MAGTAIGDVRKHVSASLAALAAFDGVLVTTAWKVGGRHRDRVYTTKAKFRQAPANMRGTARTFRDETGSFEVIVRIEGVGMNPDQTIDRALTLGTAVEEWVADNRNIATDVPGVEWLVADGDGRLQERFSDKGTLVELAYTLAYRARLT